MDRICEIVVVPDVVADGDALAAARAYAAVSGAEWRAAKRIGSTMAEDLGSIPQIPSGAQNFQNRADPVDLGRHSNGESSTDAFGPAFMGGSRYAN
jgi:hypothetical protein